MTVAHIRHIADKNISAMAGIQGNLLSAARGMTIKSLMVTSGRDREGKTTTAVSMAYALARQTQASILLVDANFQRPSLAGVFRIDADPGLREYLLADGENPDAIHDTEEPLVKVLPNQGRIGNASELMAAFDLKLQRLKSMYDYVIVDADSILHSSEAVIMTPFVDGVVLVAECEQTKWEILTLAREKVERMGGNVLGVALNKRRFYIPGMLYGKV